MRKPAFCICENKDADQLRGNGEADQAKLKKLFVWHCLPRVLLGGSVGRHFFFFFFFDIYLK